MDRFSWNLRLVGILLLVILTGCSATSVKRTTAGVELQFEAEATDGFAVVRVISLRPISFVQPKWKTMHVDSGSRSYQMHNIAGALSGWDAFDRAPATTSLYFARLPAGKYRVTGFTSSSGSPGLVGAMLLSELSNAGGELPSFTVEQGRLANLGTIIFDPGLKNESSDRLYLLNGPQGRAHAQEVLQSEGRRSDFPVPAGGGWATAVPTQEEAQLLKLARDRVSVLYGSANLDGQVAGTHLGQILYRVEPGRWKREVIDSLHTVHSVARTRDGKLVAGAEQGAYFIKDGVSWRQYRLPADTGRIVHVEPRGPAGLLLVSTDGRQTRVWTRIDVTDQADAAKEALTLKTPHHTMRTTADELVFSQNLPGIARENLITRVNKISFAMSTKTDGFWVREWQSLGQTEVMMTRVNGLSGYFSRSTDNMASWSHANTSTGRSHFWMDARRAYGLAEAAGFATVDLVLLKTVDGGQTWTKLGRPLELKSWDSRILFADPSEVVLQAADVVFSSVDEGQSWIRIFPAAPK